MPGPQFPLYLLGRRMRDVFPMVPLPPSQAVCVGIMSYNGQVNFGLIGDYDAMPGLDSLAEDLTAEIDSLAEAAPKRKKRKPAAKPKPGQKARSRARSQA